MGRKEGGCALQAGEFIPAPAANRDVRKSGGVLRYVQTLYAEGRGRIVSDIGLRGERVRAGVAGAEFIEDGGSEEVCFIERETLSFQQSVLDAGHVRPKIEFCQGRRRGQKAAGTLTTDERVRARLGVVFIAEASECRVLVACVIIQPYVSAVVIHDLVGS